MGEIRKTLGHRIELPPAEFARLIAEHVNLFRLAWNLNEMVSQRITDAQDTVFRNELREDVKRIRSERARNYLSRVAPQGSG